MGLFGQSAGSGLGRLRPRVLQGEDDMTAIAQDSSNIPRLLLTDTAGKLVLGASTESIGTVSISSVAVTSIAAGDNNIGNVDIATMPNVTIGAALPIGTNNIGDIDVLSIAAGTNNIGDVDVLTIAAGDNNIGNVDLASAIPAGTNNIGDVDILSIAAGANNIGDVDIASALPAGTAIIGAVKRDIVNYTKVWKYVALSATTETTVWDPSAGTKFVITDIFVSATAAGTCTLRDGTAGSTFLIGSFAANGGMVSNLQTPIQSATADNNLTAQASATTQYVTVCGYEV